MKEVLLRGYGSILTAELDANVLKAEGIKCRVQRGGLHQNFGSLAGADIYVLENDLEKAKDVLTI